MKRKVNLELSIHPTLDECIEKYYELGGETADKTIFEEKYHKQGCWGFTESTPEAHIIHYTCSETVHDAELLCLFAHEVQHVIDFGYVFTKEEAERRAERTEEIVKTSLQMVYEHFTREEE